MGINEETRMLTTISYIGGPRMSFRAWKSIKIGISGGRAKSVVSLTGSDFPSSKRCSLQPKGEKFTQRYKRTLRDVQDENSLSANIKQKLSGFLVVQSPLYMY